MATIALISYETLQMLKMMKAVTGQKLLEIAVTAVGYSRDVLEGRIAPWMR